MSQPAVFEIPPAPMVPVSGAGACFPVRRIFCVGRNYAAHAAEMGVEVDREAPFYFTKSAHSVALSGDTIPYPPGTRDLHHEVEFVIAIGAPAFELDERAAEAVVLGYAVGLDLTRRDLQSLAKETRRPWDLGKDFENSAVLGPIMPAAEFGPVAEQAIRLELDGRIVQEARLSELVWSVPALIANLSRYYHLAPGDLIFTGTPAGVGPIRPGARLRGHVDGLDPLELLIAG